MRKNNETLENLAKNFVRGAYKIEPNKIVWLSKKNAERLSAGGSFVPSARQVPSEKELTYLVERFY